MTDATNLAVFVTIVALRIGVPLAIPRYPLPSIIAALIIDAADQTIFQLFTTLNLDGYQSYDKALDIYYLAIAYTATMRNWANIYGFRVSRFLWYYRLVGVTAFELTQWRPLLLIFPNTFEYFFIWYEAVRTRWNPVRMAHKTILIAAALIWIFIKLPQEYWIHIAQLDTTDFIKEDILGVSVDTSWGDAISQNLWVIPVLAIVIGGLVIAFRKLWPKLPPADWRFTMDANEHADLNDQPADAPVHRRLDLHVVFEKIVLIGLIAIIFANILPGVGSNVFRVALAVAVIVTANTVISTWLARRGRTWSTVATQFGATALINLVIALLWIALVNDEQDAEASIRVLIFFVLILSLIITFYDRYRPIYEQRVALASNNRGVDSLEETK